VASIPEESLEKLLYFRREMDRIFRDFFDPSREEALTDGGHVEVPLDVFETESEIVVEAELPGLSREDLELSVLSDILIIEGNKPKVATQGGLNYQCMERSFGKFRRIVEIPGAGDTRSIKGEYDRGVLRVRLPKIQERRGHRRKVPIG
jgi:HSP20 family protein